MSRTQPDGFCRRRIPWRIARDGRVTIIIRAPLALPLAVAVHCQPLGDFRATTHARCARRGYLLPQLYACSLALQDISVCASPLQSSGCTFPYLGAVVAGWRKRVLD